MADIIRNEVTDAVLTRQTVREYKPVMLTDAQLDQIQNEVTQQAAKLSASLVMHPGVLANLLTLVSD